MGVAEIRALAEFADGLRAWLPEGAGDAPAAGADEPEAAQVADVKQRTIAVMEDGMSDNMQPGIDIDALAEKVVASLKAPAPMPVS